MKQCPRLIWIKAVAFPCPHRPATAALFAEDRLDHAAHLSPALLALDGSAGGMATLAVALFLVGLTGGATHCTAMCGPFVLAQLPGPGGESTIRLVRLLERAALPYQLGRLTTYVMLGTMAGGLGRLLAHRGDWSGLPTLLLLFAALLFLFQALARLGILAPSRAPGRIGQRMATQIARLLRPLMTEGSGGQGYALGLALGFLPCGFLYAALAASAGSGSAVGGALAMAGFALGTMPSLLAVGLIGGIAGRRWRGLAGRLAVPILLFNAAVLLRMALQAAS
jgi:sulfite exporter TauE/SafE